MNPLHCPRLLMPSLAALAVLSVVEPLRAAEVNGDLHFIITNPSSSGPFTLRQGSKCTPLGFVTGDITVNVATTTNGVTRSGIIHLKNAKGDTLTLSYSVFRSNALGGPGQGRFKIDGGLVNNRVPRGGGDIIQYFIPSNQTLFDGRMSY